MKRPRRRFQSVRFDSSAWARRLVPLILAILLVGLVASIVISILAVLGVFS